HPNQREEVRARPVLAAQPGAGLAGGGARDEGEARPRRVQRPALVASGGGGGAHGMDVPSALSSPVTRMRSTRATWELVSRPTSALRATTRLPSASTTSKLEASPRW